MLNFENTDEFHVLRSEWNESPPYAIKLHY